jgi:hypothetical protein
MNINLKTKGRAAAIQKFTLQCFIVASAVRHISALAKRHRHTL